MPVACNSSCSYRRLCRTPAEEGESPVTLAEDLSSWDKTVQSPIRFALMSILSEVDSANYRTLRSALQVSAPTLSKQITVLEDAGYVEVSKIARGRQVLTEVSLTDKGSAAYRKQLDILQRLASPYAETNGDISNTNQFVQ
ncbi:transcriptional regulator [Bifidobacterium sp. UTCIF-37]|nr:transcriptional regulator [Bifidobacterium sp. UTCIF-37]